MLFLDRDYRYLFKGAHDLGLKNAIVIAGESIAGRSFTDVAYTYAERYDGLVDLVLVGNEADQQPHEDLDESFEQTSNEWNALLDAFITYWPNVSKAGPGASSGHPEYLAGFDLHKLDYISGHPVGKIPKNLSKQLLPSGFGFGPLEGWLEQYSEFGKQLVVDEYIGKESELKDAHAVYLGAMTAQLNDPNVFLAMVYCWSDRMSPDPRAGLVREDGSIKPALAAVRYSIRNNQVWEPEIKGGKQVGQTIEQFVEQHEADLGQVWVKPGTVSKKIKRIAITDHHILFEYKDENGETWVTPIHQDDSLFQ